MKRRYVGLRPEVDEIVKRLAEKETKGQVSTMLRKLVEEALKDLGEL